MSAHENQVKMSQHLPKSVPERSKIISRIFGGIGHQLFCYAAARRLSLVNNAELIIDDVSGFKHDYDYHRQYQLDHFNIPCRKASVSERLEPFPRVRRLLKRKLNQLRSFAQRAYIQQEGIDFDPRLLQVKLQGTVYIEGYWQSENYFKDVADLIRSDLRIIPPLDSQNVAMFTLIQSNLSIAVHVRYFDSPDEGGFNNIHGDYYRRAVAYMEKIAPQSHYYIFSDRPEIARQRIPLPDDRITLVAHNNGDANAYADLWLMTQCQHFITANSTFSWWGAWLAANPYKQIIAPSFEVRQGKMGWGFDGLLPQEWIKL